MVPDTAASMEKGSPLEAPNDGGSTRVNGVEMRRRAEIPARLLFGDLPPAGADAG